MGASEIEESIARKLTGRTGLSRRRGVSVIARLKGQNEWGQGLAALGAIKFRDELGESTPTAVYGASPAGWPPPPTSPRDRSAGPFEIAAPATGPPGLRHIWHDPQCERLCG